MDVEPERVISLVKEKECARNLLKHERNQLVVNTEGAYYYIDKKKKYCLLKGLLPKLRSVFWPESNYFKLRKNASRQKSSGGGGRGKYHGRVRGTKIHRELKHFLQLDRKNYKKMHRSLHDYSARILKTLMGRMKLKPFLPEFDIFDEEMGVGTSIDMICLDQDGMLVLLEFKTGYKGYFQASDGFMKQSLSPLRNTAQNQATLQLTSAALILERKYQVPLDRMKLFVMRVDDEALDIFPIEREFVRRIGPAIYRDLLGQ